MLLASHVHSFVNLRVKIVIFLLVMLSISILFIGLLIPTGTATAPSAPILKTPSDNAYLNDKTPTLAWYKSFDQENDPLRYDILVDELNGSWSSPVINYTTAFNVISWETNTSLKDGAYKWRVRANDNKSLPDSKSTWSSVWNFTIDTEPPKIVSGSGNFMACTGRPFMIYANYSDNTSVISTSTIYYKKPAEPSYRAQIMLQAAVNQFYIDNQLLGINTTNNDDDYVYYILAEDKAGNTYKYCTASSSDFLISVRDTEPPVVISGTEKITITTGDDFLIFINCQDNIGLGGATLYIRKLGHQWMNTGLNKYSENKYGINYSELKSGLDVETSDGVNWEYFVLVYDSSNNIFNYTVFNVTHYISASGVL